MKDAGAAEVHIEDLADQPPPPVFPGGPRVVIDGAVRIPTAVVVDENLPDVVGTAKRDHMNFFELRTALTVESGATSPTSGPASATTRSR